MKSLVILLDRTAPSFCYYDAAPGAEPSSMDDALLCRGIEYAQQHGLALQFVCGRSGLPARARDALISYPAVCYVPAGVEAASEDVPVVTTADPDQIRLVPAARHAIAVLRVDPSDIDVLPTLWRELAERVYRVVLVLLGLDRVDEATLARYRAALATMSAAIELDYRRGRELELNVISDRMGLTSPRECGAGVEHLTLGGDGRLYVCPGFAVDGATPVGDLEHGVQVPNGDLLRRDRAPICSLCDAYQCRRCVYLNQRATLELNTPSWQMCRSAHIERETSRQLLANLHQARCLEHLPPLPPVNYDDPLSLALGTTHRAANVVVAPTKLQDKEPHMASTPVGRVSPAERDEIRDLYLRKHGLTELFASLSKLDATTLAGNPLYDKLVRDMGLVSLEFQSWWDRMAAKYGWEQGRRWRIDFEACEVHLDGDAK